MLSNNVATYLDIAVKHSIHLFMDENVNDCLGDNGEVTDITHSEILDIFMTVKYILKMLRKKLILILMEIM
jgi:hypothetical protein